MNKVGWIIFSAVVVLALGGLIVWTRIANPPINLSGVNNNSIIAASTSNGNIADHVTGKLDSKVMFIEFGDYQCPSCGGAYPNLKTLLNDYGSKITFVFRNFPLTTIHPNARAAAAVAEAAGLQGKYWEMHDTLYQNQNDWNSLDTTQRAKVFDGYAQTLGLNMDQFHKDIASSRVDQKISFDQALGKQENVDATPTFFLNGKKLDDTAASGIVQGDLTQIRSELDALLK
ncbi:MAG TPA: thioredoxin domain-containing protein [Dongiaceae bacterium]|nr:thioredoxin domain-containing protein [Dongiaceae bacterium]